MNDQPTAIQDSTEIRKSVEHQTVFDRLLQASRKQVLSATAALIALLVLTEWLINIEYSLGILYTVPMVVGGTALNRKQILLLAPVCAFARGLFTTSLSPLEMILRFVMATLAYSGAGLFVHEARRNRQMYISHIAQLEKQQALRREAEEQLRVLVESSPAAIMTLDGSGRVLAANRATLELLAANDFSMLIGQAIHPYIPVFSDALKLDGGPRTFRTAAQCWGRRTDGQPFVAQTWFSTYGTDKGKRLAAIAVDSSEEMRDLEEQHWQQLVTNNRVIAGAVSHEIRNLSAAASVMCSNLERLPVLFENEDFRALEGLVRGLHNLASFELNTKAKDIAPSADLKDVLGRFRLISEPAWHEMEGALMITVPSDVPAVLADPHELLQVFLNLCQNSLRAVQETSERSLRVTVEAEANLVSLRFEDSGPGVKHPELLFQALHKGADSTGLGLYVSRALVRSFGGEVRYDQVDTGACFVVELARYTAVRSAA